VAQPDATMSTTTIQTRPDSALLGSPAPLIVAGFAAPLIAGVAQAVSPATGVAVLFGFVCLPAILLSLPFGILLWVPLDFVELLTPGPTVVGMLVVLAWLGTLPVRHRTVGEVIGRHRGLFGALALLLVWVTLSVAWAGDSGAAANNLYLWFSAAAVLLVLTTTVTTPRFAVALCGAFIAGALIAVLFGLVAKPPPPEGGAIEAGRFAGTFGDPNNLAAVLVPAIALATGIAAATRRIGTRWLLAGAIGVLVAALTATGSRGGLTAALVSIVAAIALARGSRMRVGVLLALVVTVGGLFIATTSSATWDRVREFSSGGGTGRTDLWDIAWKMASDHPINGVGENNFRSASVPYLLKPGAPLDAGFVIETPRVVHNVFLQQLAETGIVGLGLLIGVIIACVRAAWLAAQKLERGRDPSLAALARAVVVAQLGMLSASIFISNALDKRLWMILALGPIFYTVASRLAGAEERRGVI